MTGNIISVFPRKDFQFIKKVTLGANATSFQIDGLSGFNIYKFVARLNTSSLAQILCQLNGVTGSVYDSVVLDNATVVTNLSNSSLVLMTTSLGEDQTEQLIDFIIYEKGSDGLFIQYEGTNHSTTPKIKTFHGSGTLDTETVLDTVKLVITPLNFLAGSTISVWGLRE